MDRLELGGVDAALAVEAELAGDPGLALEHGVVAETEGHGVDGGTVVHSRGEQDLAHGVSFPASIVIGPSRPGA